MFEARKLLAVAVGLGLVLALAGGALAAEETKAETFKGMVKVVKADDGKVTSVTLTVRVKKEETVYTLAGDKVKEMEALDKKYATVTGQVTEKDGVKTLTVESFKEIVRQGKSAGGTDANTPK
jgi:hypothetical protein